MSIEKRVLQVEALFYKLELEITEFQSHTKLSCLTGCGKCCTNPEIDASPLEFLPWAFHIYLNGNAEKILRDLNNRATSTCYIYNPLSLLDKNNGNCSEYKYRGLICRLFGFGANKDKYGQYRLATCKIIKEGQKENFEKSSEAINNGLSVPIFTDYYMNLSQIDFRLGNQIVPINKALQFAIEEVLQYYSYRPMPNGFHNCA
ncbi:YkgJ family cysteine cluster protein [Flavobacterium jejuense]|uniref:YkgJ family cysteine cluster protein n=1 Tax=Flavobacterium jejuense TaxID=1544455 RepID=A0ABX0IQQ6_9FLAO|nr:YkgJ family cysteine cluster protein [Flavobacterium jejuense]NHN24219.1 YkgJ family cysteine cluster protein [Flavobacterium jejuense]